MHYFQTFIRDSVSFSLRVYQPCMIKITTGYLIVLMVLKLISCLMRDAFYLENISLQYSVYDFFLFPFCFSFILEEVRNQHKFRSIQLNLSQQPPVFNNHLSSNSMIQCILCRINLHVKIPKKEISLSKLSQKGDFMQHRFCIEFTPMKWTAVNL